MYIIRLFKHNTYSFAPLDNWCNRCCVGLVARFSAPAMCMHICACVCMPLLFPSAALWCPNGAGITTGDHKQQLCPVRPHSAVYQQAALMKPTLRWQSAAGKDTESDESYGSVFYTCILQVFTIHSCSIGVAMTFGWWVGPNWNISATAPRGWIPMILVISGPVPPPACQVFTYPVKYLNI